MKLPGTNTLTPCCLCPANSTDCPWRDFRPTLARWLSRVWTPSTWLRAFAKHIFFSLPGVSITTVLADLLHVKHLGTDMYFAASVFFLLCYEILPGSTHNNDTGLGRIDTHISVSKLYSAQIVISIMLKMISFKKSKVSTPRCILKSIRHPTAEP